MPIQQLENKMELARTIKDVTDNIKAARSQGKTVGLVPTMGALHIGHISLIEKAKKQTDYVVVSIFVNPTQFGPAEDFEKYPRQLEDDLEICKKAGVDLVFAPDTKQIYPNKNLTWINVDKLTEPLCGKSRPGHFRGVTTVCAKLFNIVLADKAFFGQKDAQQAAVIKRMVSDLNMPLKIVICPTIREQNGLAVSSRNKYLTEQQKAQATLIYKSLQKAQSLIKADTKNPKVVIKEMQKILNQADSMTIEYIEIVNAETMQSLNRITGKVLIAVAVKIDSTRLIDNIKVDAG